MAADSSSTLENLNFCAVCTKLLNWTTTSKTSDIISAFLDTTENDDKDSSSPCRICLDILENRFGNDTTNDTIEKLRKAKFDMNSFNLAITFPPSCLFREKVAQLWKKRNSSDLSVGQSSFVFSLKDACRICYQAAFERLLESDGMKFDAQSDFTISLTFENAKADNSCRVLQRYFPDRFLKSGKKKDGNNSEWSRTSIMDVLPLLTDEMLKESDVRDLFSGQIENCTVVSSFTRLPLFIGGRYCKYSRYLTQSPWVIDGVRRGDSSVQELISDQIKLAVGAEDAKFTSSGREDTDVRMLGDGRPFAIQLINARRKRTLDQLEIDNFQRLINKSTRDISVNKLRMINAQEFSSLKEGEEHKKKTYVALISSTQSLSGDMERNRIRELSSLGPIELEQKTPIRVLHRRPLAIRKRTVEDFKVILLNDHSFLLRLTTQAGTYVKEFVHGDFGRTVPSLSDLLGGIPVDIIELDVDQIHLNWP